MMKNTKILFGWLVAILLAANSCKCPQCPACPTESNIVTDDVDTVSFRIVTDDVDTVSFKIAAPVISVDGKVQKASIVIDNVDMARVIMDQVDTTKYRFEARPRVQPNIPQQSN